MFRSIAIAAAALTMTATPSFAATHCRDAHGKFTKCAAVQKAPAKPVRCKDAKGKFTKCATAAAKPVK